MSVAVSPQRIKKLPEDLINHIAAGEVIERPASVVKELLENSLDAGANRITVTVKGGGTRLIRIEDNGHGIHKDDLLLAIDRHTTSKLNEAGDLARIRTLGFRGEALSSIASVSRFTLTSRCHEDEVAWSLSNTIGKAELKPAAHPPGTTIEVRDLFHNVPARRKFLRTENTELLHIQETIRRIALSRPMLALRFIHNDRQLLQIAPSGDDPSTRAAAVYGRSFTRAARRVEYRAQGLQLSGWLGAPEQARSQTDRQYFYLNGRSIRDRQVSHAVRQAVQDRIYPGRHPVYLLYLEMSPEAVDVNVHPGKQEVRFRNPRDVHDFIYSALSDALSRDTPVDDETGRQSVATGSSVNESRAGYRPSPAIQADSRQSAVDRTIMICRGAFLLVDSPDGLLLIDVPGARELLAFSRLRESLQTGAIRRRPMLVPITMTVSGQESECAERHHEFLDELGMVIECIAPRTLLVREIPLLLAEADAVALTRDVIGHCLNQPGINADDPTVLRLLARHVNDTPTIGWSTAEAENLVREIKSNPDPLVASELKTVMHKIGVKELRRLIRHGK